MTTDSGSGKAPFGCSQQFELRRADNDSHHGTLAWVGANDYTALKADISNILHPNERHYFDSVPAERRRVTYLLGRYAAKRAVADCVGDLPMATVEISTGVFKNPVLNHPAAAGWSVSISHLDTLACAVAYPSGHPVALDIETVAPERAAVMATQSTGSERDAFLALNASHDAACAILWTAKEAVSKALHTGMMCSFELFTIEAASAPAAGQYAGEFKHFPQYRFHTWLATDRAFTFVVPKRTQIVFPNARPLIMDAWPDLLAGESA